MVIDTHTHLNFDSYSQDQDQVIQRAKEAGVTAIISVGTDLKTSQEVLELTSDQVSLYPTIGIHPHEAALLNSEEKLAEAVDKLRELYEQNKERVVGVGETGLDFFFRYNEGFHPSDLSEDDIKQWQKQLFQAQVDLAQEWNLPVIIHCRDSWQEVFNLDLKKTTGVFHSFTGSLEDAHQATELGYYLAFSCMITYPKNDHLREIIKQIPLEYILTETDSPFLPPQPIRGQRNEPKFVTEVVKVIAEIKQLSYEQVAQTTSHSAQGLFHLPA